ncbi:hypothetical protein MVEN_01531500 [Mycena venus]|uniref:Uncharacterized protein n=1 Tax=Mycena venus TaxID=2733690 RepID=A0A8H7CTR5_9AGAR|nr:hypothetical protein MVEN_01531500 [Mycena venus]
MQSAQYFGLIVVCDGNNTPAENHHGHDSQGFSASTENDSNLHIPAPTHKRGATARSAASPRVSSSLAPAAARRTSLKAAPPEPRDALTASLKQETDQKEQLLVQVQNKDETIATLSTENANLTSALHAAETRINELYTDQSRSELDLAQRIEISENLRAQVRELEKEKRDVQRRYNEQVKASISEAFPFPNTYAQPFFQTSTFEAERQAFYDNEQHLKSRIMSLTQARKQPERPHVDASSLTADTESIDMDDPETEPAEMTSLRLELSTLATSYSSLQSTLVLLQTQLVDLKRVNHELQEENESYMILLRERTLSGQFDVMKQVGAGGSSDGETDDDDDDDEDERASADVGSLRSAGRSILDKVEEEEDGQEVETLEQQLERSLASPRETDSPSSNRPPGRSGRKRTGSQSHSPSVRGESLADLPITGPGLDLAAELGRAENKDILDGNVVDDQDRSVLNGKKRSKKSSTGRKDFDGPGGMEPSTSMSDVDALRSEVKSLKDANKALSLYASKIIDRIISQEGFEHVLAVDYEKEPQTPKTPSTAIPTTKALPAVLPLVKPRPQSAIAPRSTPGTPSLGTSAFTSPSILPTSPKIGTPPNPKTQRRSLSFDWKAFSIFSGEKKPAENPNLRPLTLKPGAGSVTGNARKLETHEDENDRRERERMNATMKLMGIQPQPSPVFPPSVPPPAPAPASVPATPSRRFSFFSRAPAAPAPPTEGSDASSVHSSGSGRIGLGIGLGAPGLTQEALEHAEAENSLAALDAHERTLSAEIAKGSTGGFTEIAPRRARARRSQGGSRSGSGNGSTVWSAGEDDEE